MGVKGLWKLLLPIGRRISIETLEGKVLAIDASIWMTQFLKAMRDKESGAVTPAAHIIGFFRRLCRLAFHGIRPIFVFDGATPEIKRRELAARRKRRDQFVATHGPAAIQRMAKKLLVDQLKKSKTMTTRVDSENNNNPQIQISTTAVNNNNNNRGGAFASGFHLPEWDKQQQETEQPESKDAEDNVQNQEDDQNASSKFEMTEDGVIITGVSKSNSTLFQDPEQKQPHNEENDWDKPILNDVNEYDLDDDEDTTANQQQNASSDNEQVEYDDVLWNSRRRNNKKHKKKPSGDELLDIEYVSSLPPTERKDAIEEAKKRQRMRSRSEFMPVAANADGYSQAQLRNFLRSSKLNQDIVKMAKKAVHQDSKLHGEVTASDRTRRVIFQKDDDAENNPNFGKDSESSDNDDSDNAYDSSVKKGFLSTRERPSNVRRLLAKQPQQQQQQQQQQQPPGETTSPRHKLRKFGSHRVAQQSSGSVDSDDDLEEGGGGFSSSGTKDVQKQSIPAESSTHPFANDANESDDSDDGAGFMPSGGGFVIREETVALAARKQKASTTTKKVVLSDSEDSAEGGGFFRSTNDNKTIEQSAGKNILPYATKPKPTTGAVGNIFRDVDDDESSQEGGGGFLREKPIPTNMGNLKSTGLEDEVIVIDEDGSDSDENLESTATLKDLVAQELQDRMLARALQEEEDAQAAAGFAETSQNVVEELSSKKPAATRPLATSPSDSTDDRDNQNQPENQSTMLLAASDDSEDEDIDWENGDEDTGEEKKASDDDEALESPNRSKNTIEQAMDVERLDSDGGPRAKPPPGPQALVGAHIQPVIDIGDSDSEDVDWEDGDGKNGDSLSASKVRPNIIDREQDEKDQIVEERGSPIPDPGVDKDDEAFLPAEEDIQDSDHGTNDFEGNYASENLSAFQQAESTAANLTNWAGRAMRRAIAEYSKEASGSPNAEATKQRPSLEAWEEKPVDGNDGVTLQERKHKEGYNENASNDNGGGNMELVFNEEKSQEAAQLLRDYETELDGMDKDNVERETDTVTDEMTEEVMQLLQLFGIPFIQAPSEAEAQCVALEKLGLVSGVVTEDSDAFVFGGRTIYKHIFDEQKYVEVYAAEDAEREMGLGPNEMVALAMLLGGDYTEGVKGVGIVNGMEVISAFDVSKDLKAGLQKFREWLDGFEPIVDAKSRKDAKSKNLTKEQEFHIKHRSARTRWDAPETFPSDNVISAYVNPVVDKSDGRFSWGCPDVDNIVTFCSKHAGWPAEETKRMLEPIVQKVKSSYRQTRIDSFMRYEDSIKFANVRSKRLRDVLSAVHDDKDEEEMPSGEEDTSNKKTTSSTNKKTRAKAATTSSAAKSRPKKTEGTSTSKGTKRKRATKKS